MVPTTAAARRKKKPKFVDGDGGRAVSSVEPVEQVAIAVEPSAVVDVPQVEQAQGVDGAQDAQEAVHVEESAAVDSLVEGGVKITGKTNPLLDLVLYGGSPDFIALRMQFEVEVRQLRMKAPAHVFAARMAELTRRQLDVDAVDLALQRRRVAAEAHAREVAEELHTPPDRRASEIEQQRIQDCVLQLFRVLTRRRMSVLRGEQLPRLDSVFAKVKLE